MWARDPTPESIQRLEQEVHTGAVIRERSHIPITEVYAYETKCDNVVGVPFTIIELIPRDTAMDSSGGYTTHKGSDISSTLSPD
ncbi:hypothetical protein B7494_g7189 [Chlorociboria aeruginascens]|nr:hypothetical protein B7494_g7189 [Chlorociboria aeruginascens]